MKHALLAVLLVAATAHADNKAVDALVRGHLSGLASGAENPGLAEDAVMVLPEGPLSDLKVVGCSQGIHNEFYGCVQASVTHKPGKLSIVADDAKGVAWFLAPFTVTIQGDNPDTGEPAKPDTYPMRLGGVATRSGKAWSIVAGMYTLPISDAKLLARKDGTLGGTPKLTGDAALAKTAAAWLEGGLAASASKTTASLMAAGTSPTELGTGAAALKLAKAWDKLKLDVNDLDAKIVKDGVAFVHGTVSMPKKNGKGSVAMGVAVIAVREGDAWRWTLLDFQAAWNHVEG